MNATFTNAAATNALGSDSLSLVTFQSAGRTFGIDIRNLREIIRFRAPVHLPLSQEHLLGLINLRGVLLPVLDLRRCLGLPETAHGEHSRIVVVQARDRQVGFVVDAISEIAHVRAGDVDQSSPLFDAASSDYMAGVVKHQGRLLIALAPDRLLARFAPGQAMPGTIMADGMSAGTPTVLHPVASSAPTRRSPSRTPHPAPGGRPRLDRAA